MDRLIARYALVALSFVGSAILLFSCDNADEDDQAASEEMMMTEYNENLSVVNSQNGRRSYYFETPLVEGYQLAREPYREFRKGVKVITYKDDSLSTVDGVLTANYAIYYEKRKLWEAKGNVVVEKSDGKTLYTQQLFWNERTGKIYSNVDSKIVQNAGRDVFIGEGFESDAEFKDWRFRRMKGRMEVEMKQGAQSDSTAVSAPPVPNDVSAGPAVESGTSRQARPGNAAKAAPGSAQLPETTMVPAPSLPSVARPEVPAAMSEEQPMMRRAEPVRSEDAQPK